MIASHFRHLQQLLETHRLKVLLESDTVYTSPATGHYMSPDSELIFRYDNAPHYRDVRTFPHHKHQGSQILSTATPNLQKVLNEIDRYIIRKMVH